MKVDLGCGKVKDPGWIGVDFHKGNNPDIHADITKHILELRNDCASEVRCHHVIEHLPLEQWRNVFLEMDRILEHKGKFEIKLPHPACKNAMIHGHVHVMTPLFWHNIKNGMIRKKDSLCIVSVIEVPNNKCQEFCERKGFNFEEWAPYLFDAYTETIISGYKP